MKQIHKLSILAAMSLLLFGCGPKFNGKSEKEFEASKKVVAQKLSKEDDAKMEKAIRVIVLKALYLKFNEESGKYNNVAVGQIALQLIDGKTSGGVISEAEDFLKDDQERKLAKLTAEVDTLERQVAGQGGDLKRMADLFKLETATFKKMDFFGKQVPELSIEYTYIGKQPLAGPTEILITLFKAGTQDVVSSTGMIESKQMVTGDSFKNDMILDKLAEADPQKWNAITYSTDKPDWQKLGLQLDVHPVSLILNGKTLAAPAPDTTLTRRIAQKKVELKNEQNLKGTLDEFERTK